MGSWFERSVYEPKVNKILLEVFKKSIENNKEDRIAIVYTIYKLHNILDSLITANNTMALAVKQALERIPKPRSEEIVEASEDIGKVLTGVLIKLMDVIQKKYKLQPIEATVALANAMVGIMSKALKESADDETTMKAFTFEVLEKVMSEYPEIADEVINDMLKRY